MRNRIFLSLLLTLAAVCAAHGQAAASSKKGIALKTPNPFMQAPLEDFNGVLMLNRDAPSVIVASYPNKAESIDDLIKRLQTRVAGFFDGDKAVATTWTSKPVPAHDGDKPDSGVLFTGTQNGSQLRFVVFQKEVNGQTVVYGYAAMRNSKTKDSDAKKYWPQEDGRGVKPFEEFVTYLHKNN